MSSTLLSIMEPIQIASTLGAAINFGGSVLQSPLIMPTLTDTVVKVPIQYAAKQTAYLLHESEHYFPPLNALCSLSNLIMSATAYYYSGDSAIMAAKFPRLAAATVLNLATTAWALGIQVPKNKRMAVLAKEIEDGVAKSQEKESSHKAKEDQFRALQKSWAFTNYGRAAIMISSAIAGAAALIAKP